MSAIAPSPPPFPPASRTLVAPLPLAALVVTLTACASVTELPLPEEEGCLGPACACPPASGDCDGLESTGCETDLLGDRDHCGGCGNACGEGSCNNGQCECFPGFQDCDGLAATGCEAELAWDGLHCGSCGRDCLGGDCVQGQCQPVELGSPTDHVSDLTLVDDQLFWHGLHQLATMPLDDDGAASLIAGSDCPNVRSMASDGQGVYWGCDDKGIMGMPAAGAEPTLLVPGAAAWSSDSTGQRSLAVGEDWLYWTELEGDSFTLYRATKHGSGAAQWVTDDAGPELLLTDDYLYFMRWSSVELWRVPIAASSPEPEVFDAAPDMSGLATYFAGEIYWTTWHGTVWKRAETSGPAVQVAADLPFMPTALAVDESGIYATDFWDAQIGWIDPATGAGTIIASHQAGAGFPLLDATHLYWTAFGGVARLAK